MLGSRGGDQRSMAKLRSGDEARALDRAWMTSGSSPGQQGTRTRLLDKCCRQIPLRTFSGRNRASRSGCATVRAVPLDEPVFAGFARALPFSLLKRFSFKGYLCESESCTDAL